VGVKKEEEDNCMPKELVEQNFGWWRGRKNQTCPNPPQKFGGEETRNRKGLLDQTARLKKGRWIESGCSGGYL